MVLPSIACRAQAHSALVSAHTTGLNGSGEKGPRVTSGKVFTFFASVATASVSPVESSSAAVEKSSDVQQFVPELSAASPKSDSAVTSQKSLRRPTVLYCPSDCAGSEASLCRSPVPTEQPNGSSDDAQAISSVVTPQQLTTSVHAKQQTSTSMENSSLDGLHVSFSVSEEHLPEEDQTKSGHAVHEDGGVIKLAGDDVKSLYEGKFRSEGESKMRSEGESRLRSEGKSKLRSEGESRCQSLGGDKPHSKGESSRIQSACRSERKADFESLLRNELKSVKSSADRSLEIANMLMQPERRRSCGSDCSCRLNCCCSESDSMDAGDKFFYDMVDKAFGPRAESRTESKNLMSKSLKSKSLKCNNEEDAPTVVSLRRVLSKTSSGPPSLIASTPKSTITSKGSNNKSKVAPPTNTSAIKSSGSAAAIKSIKSSRNSVSAIKSAQRSNVPAEDTNVQSASKIQSDSKVQPGSKKVYIIPKFGPCFASQSLTRVRVAPNGKRTIIIRRNFRKDAINRCKFTFRPYNIKRTRVELRLRFKATLPPKQA